MHETINPQTAGNPHTTGSLRIETVFLLTTSRQGQRETELTRLAQAVERARQSMPHVTIRHYLLLQDASAAISVPGGWNLHTTPRLLGLSAARNILLALLPTDLLDDTAVIAFPDDDAWYADGSLAGILAAFSAEPNLDFWFCCSGPDATWDKGAAAHPPQIQQLLSHATSNTLFLRARLAALLGKFDETLGLGTPAKSGEDTDYALRAYQAARTSLFLPATAVGHRRRDRRDRELYFEGALFAIARHAPVVSGGFFALLRKIAIGIVLTAMGRITLARLWTSLRSVYAAMILKRR